MKKAYIDTVIEGIAETQGITKEEAAAQYVKDSDYVLDFDSLPKQQHAWTMRGLKATCEGANHPYHEFWFKRSAL